MAGHGKAHTAVANRIANRYNTQWRREEHPDILTAEFAVEVETTATLAEGLERLSQLEGPTYVAVTNQEALRDAMRLTQGTPVGVMDPKGNILKKSGKQ
jgi:hypothetical protein